MKQSWVLPRAIPQYLGDPERNGNVAVNIYGENYFSLLKYNYSTYLYKNTLILLMYNFSLLKYNYSTSSKDNHPVDVYFSKGNKCYIGSWGLNIFYPIIYSRILSL
jgi:hypothetical protein